MKTHRHHMLIAIVLSLTLVAIIWLVNTHQSVSLNISFSDIDGKTHTLSDYQGKSVLVVFWATDCPGCIQEMPELIKLDQNYSSEVFTIIAVAMQHDALTHVMAMREKRDLPYIITWDQDGSIAANFDNVRVTPTHFLIAPDGEIALRKIGVLNINALHEKLEKMGITPNYL